VFQHTLENFPIGEFKPFLWAFVDVDARSACIPEQFADLEAHLYVMFTTSPERQRWKPLTKTTLCAEVVMNPWSLEEIHQA